MKVKKLLENFKLKLENPKDANIEKNIDGPAIHRLGLELAGLVAPNSKSKKIIGWGTTENNWLAKMTQKEAKEKIQSILSKDTPLILCSTGVKPKVLKLIIESTKEFNVAVAKVNSHLSGIRSNIGMYLQKYFAKAEDVHGSLVIVNGIGVMIIGKSGIGKSEAVLELIQKGHTFVSDDTVVVKRIGNEFIGEPSEITKNFLEARGLGFVDIKDIYGAKSVREATNIELVIELLPASELNKVDRLGNQDLKYKIHNGFISKIQIPVENGRSLSALIEAGTNVYYAKKQGVDPLSVIKGRTGRKEDE